jgi:SAM-dependent methyltransferase
MKAQHEQYSGLDNLEAMRGAKNYNNSILKLILKYGPSTSDSKVLDFGAGIGTFTNLLRELGRVVDCLEPDHAMATLLRSSGYKVYDLTQDVPNGYYDYIYMANVLEHIEDDAHALKDIAAKLKPNGRLLIYVPAFELLFSAMDEKVGHYRRYTQRSLKKVITNAGLLVVESRYADVIGFFATVAYKAFGDKNGRINEKQVTFFDKRIFPLNAFLDRVIGRFLGKNVYCVCKQLS